MQLAKMSCSNIAVRFVWRSSNLGEPVLPVVLQPRRTAEGARAWYQCLNTSVPWVRGGVGCGRDS